MRSFRATALLLTFVVAALAGCVAANAAIDKVVYRDANYALSWQNETIADQITSYLADHGFTVVDAAGLRDFCLKHIKDRATSVIVMANDVAPDTVMDPVGPNYDPNPVNTFMQYLSNGGKVIYMSDWPAYYIGLPDGTRPTWGDTGSARAFGFYVCRWNSGVTDLNVPVTFTDEGKKWGLSKPWQSKRAALVSDIDIVLGNPTGKTNAAMPWVKNFCFGRPGAGFIYLYDLPGNDMANGGNPVVTEPFDDRDLAQILSVANYFPQGEVKLYGINGIVKDSSGKPVPGTRVKVTDVNGVSHMVQAADDGTFSIGVVPGDYTLSPQGEELEVTPGGTKVTVTTSDVNVDVIATTLPSMSLGSSDGITWKLYDYADNNDPTMIATDATDFAAANPAFNDSSWQTVTVPGDVTQGAVAPTPVGTNTYFWYRAKFQLPAAMKAMRDRYLILYNYNIDDSDWTFFNGHLLGSMEQMAGTQRKYAVDPSWVNWDGDNVIAIKAWNGGGAAGVTAQYGTPKLHVGSAMAGQIAGTVTLKDVAGALPAGVTLSLTSADGATKLTTTPTGAGTFRFLDLLPGTYTLTATGRLVGQSTPASIAENVVGGKLLSGQDLAVTYAAFPILPKVVDKAVYYDPGYDTSWINDAEAQQARDYFVSQGYTEVDAVGLAGFMQSHITSKVPSVVVLSQDIVPDTVVDITSGAVASKSILSSYLAAGGRVLQYGDIPFYNIGQTGGGRFNAGNNGATALLGFNAAGGGWDVGDLVTLTPYANALGLKSTWHSQRPANVNDIDVPLMMSTGGAAGWIKFYPDKNGPGAFMRLVDRGPENGVFTDDELADGKRLAEVSGEINGPGLAPAGAPPVTVVKGDASGDGKVLVNDAVLALQFAVGLKTPTADQLAACDLNGDGKVGINEATLILQAAVGLRTL